MTDHSALPLQFSVWLIRALHIALGALVGGFGVVLFVGSVYEWYNGASAGLWAPLLGCGLLGLVLAPFSLRVGLLPSAEISDTAVTIRGNLRSSRIPLADILDVEVVPGGSPLLPWKVPALRLRAGELVRVEHLQVLGEIAGTPIEAFSSAIRDRIQPAPDDLVMAKTDEQRKGIVVLVPLTVFCFVGTIWAARIGSTSAALLLPLFGGIFAHQIYDLVRDVLATPSPALATPGSKARWLRVVRRLIRPDDRPSGE